METMPLPDLPASFSRAATGIRRSSPCAAAAFFVRAAQVITKPGVSTARVPAAVHFDFVSIKTPYLETMSGKCPRCRLKCCRASSD